MHKDKRDKDEVRKKKKMNPLERDSTNLLERNAINAGGPNRSTLNPDHSHYIDVRVGNEKKYSERKWKKNQRRNSKVKMNKKRCK